MGSWSLRFEGALSFLNSSSTEAILDLKCLLATSGCIVVRWAQSICSLNEVFLDRQQVVFRGLNASLYP